MQDVLQTSEPQKERRFPLATMIIAAVVVAAIALSVWYLVRPPAKLSAVEIHQSLASKMTPEEKAYVSNLHVENIAMTRAENGLHQEITTIAGDLANNGTQPVLGLILTIEFHDSMEQVVLRESRGVLGGVKPAPLMPGERRNFEINFDNVPASWNMQVPTLRLAQLRLPTAK
jgi:hypothetical protein